MLIAVVIAGSATQSLAATVPGADPDWPCMQRKVPELSPAAVWNGPPLDAAFERWQADAEVAALVPQLASRRNPPEQAETAISSFAERLDPAVRSERLTLLFAGLFQSLDRQRSTIMEGIDRYGRRQKAIAEQIRADQLRLSDLNSAGNDPQSAAALTGQLQLQTQIFNARRGSLSFVCEVPTLIEQRLFALGRIIAENLPK